MGKIYTKEEWFQESTKRKLDKQASEWLENNDSSNKKNNDNVIKSDENGILSERQLRRLSQELESPISHFQADDEHNIFDWIQGQKNVEVVKESIPVTKVADKEYVVSIVQAQVHAFMNSAESNKVTENMALAYELVYNQGMNFTDAGTVIGIHRTNVMRTLIKFFKLVNLELHCGINVNDKVLEQFMHKSVLALRNAKQKWSSIPKVSKEQKALSDAEYGLNAPTFTWTAQNGLPVAHPLKGGRN